ncbi:MAG: FxLYD domain-containing protein [Chloroflexota bacterium]
MRKLLILLLLLLPAAGCAEDAVVFAPTPQPPDVSPLTYTHPGGAFSLTVPRTWAVHTQSYDDLASAYFTPPQAAVPSVGITLIQVDETSSDLSITEILNQYQSTIRPDRSRYTEQDRQAMTDGSWRLTGVRTEPGGTSTALNTFIVPDMPYLAVMEVIIPDDPTQLAEIDQIINTLRINPEPALQSTPLDTLAQAGGSDLRVRSISAWRTSQGIYFITGEITNTSNRPIGGVPINISLLRADDTVIVDASDTSMGYVIEPGEDAPFSLRFGQGQPPDAVRFQLALGTFTWSPEDTTPANVVSEDGLTWGDNASISSEGHYTIEGTVTNTGELVVTDPVAVVTVVDAQGNIIAAAFTSLSETTLRPDDTAAFFFRIQELGGVPFDHIVDVQALPVNMSESTPDVETTEEADS